MLRSHFVYVHCDSFSRMTTKELRTASSVFVYLMMMVVSRRSAARCKISVYLARQNNFSLLGPFGGLHGTKKEIVDTKVTVRIDPSLTFHIQTFRLASIIRDLEGQFFITHCAFTT